MADIETSTTRSIKKTPALPGQVVLVFQGGGALGAYQGGVYQALHEAGIEPDWVIGTSIGAINAAIIAGNEPSRRLERLREFWKRMERKSPWDAAAFMQMPVAQPLVLFGGNVAAQMMTIFGGVAIFRRTARLHLVSTPRSASSGPASTRSMRCTRR
jgi:predicted acylesterase/phospholipase RssA